MDAARAERTVTTSAVVVAAVYAYRRLYEGQSGQAAQHVGQKDAAKQLLGAGGAPPLSHFIVGWGFAYVVIAIMAQADPKLGAGFAVLIATGTVLANGVQIFQNVERQIGIKKPAKATAGASSNPPAPEPEPAAPSEPPTTQG